MSEATETRAVDEPIPTNRTATGNFVANHMITSGGEPIPEERIQPNGVDLTISKIERVSGRADFYRDGDYDKPERMTIKPNTNTDNPEAPVYAIPSGEYIITYDEVIEIPRGYVGRVYPRSRIMRSGMHLRSALWDQGYEGRGEGELSVPRSLNRVTIPTDMAVGQMAFFPANEPVEMYDGSHQREGIDNE